MEYRDRHAVVSLSTAPENIVEIYRQACEMVGSAEPEAGKFLADSLSDGLKNRASQSGSSNVDGLSMDLRRRLMEIAAP